MQGQLNAQQEAMRTQQQNYDNNTQQSAEQVRIDTITRIHSDAINLTNSVDFLGWLSRQPAYMQSLMPNGPAKEIVDLISAYKNSKNVNGDIPPAALDQQQQNLETARLASVPDITSPAPKLTPNPSKRIYSNAEIGAMSYQEYAALAEDIDLAIKEDRVTI